MQQQGPLQTPLRINGYRQSSSLLFQFILSDLIQSDPLVKEIHSQAQRCRQTSTPPFIQSISDHYFKELKTSISKLVGSSQDYMRIFAWTIEDGILAKLKNNCGFFAQHAGNMDKNAHILHRYANNSWMLCLRCLDIMRAIEHDLLGGALNRGKSVEYYTNVLFQTLEKMSFSIQKLSRILVRLLMNFKEDENVVFFLLRHQEQLETLYGSGFIIKVFQQMYPKGIEQAETFLLKKYAQRGFNNLLPTIKAKISELECCVK